MTEPLPPLKPRKLTLAKVREALRGRSAPISDEQLAEALQVVPETIRNNVVRWVQIAAGVRCVRQGPKACRGWSYMPQEECAPYEPATPTVEELVGEVARLRAEVAGLLVKVEGRA